MRIALDAMGGDNAPHAIVEAAVETARKHQLGVALLGPQEVLEPLLVPYAPLPPSLTLRYAPEVVAMDEHPSAAVRGKKASSIAVGMELVKSGEADAFVSAGNTGAIMAYALLGLGRLPGIERPALGTVFSAKSGPCLLLDVGANADCKPSYLLQFARMGAAYMQGALGVSHVRVGLLNIGEEEGKGSQLAQEAYQLLKSGGIDFVGNVEGKDLPQGLAEVVVTDGFTGNVAIKVAEGVSEFLMSGLRDSLTSRWHYRLAAATLRPAFRGLARRLDYAEYGGAPLLGVRGVVIIGHGRSNARAIQRALLVARQAVEGAIIESIGASARARQEAGG